MATSTTPFTSGGANLGDRHRAPQARRARGGVHDLDGVQSGACVDGRHGIGATGIEEGGQLELERLVAADAELLLAAVDGLPPSTALDVLAGVEGDRARAVVGDQTAALADDHALAMGTGHEVVGLDDDGHVAIADRDHREIVETAAEEVALQRGGRRRLAAEQVREEGDVMDAVGVEDADVGTRALEAGEAAGW